MRIEKLTVKIIPTQTLVSASRMATVFCLLFAACPTLAGDDNAFTVREIAPGVYVHSGVQ
jgi:hypothetical protein